MYLLFLDESGTHDASPAFITGGLAVHEEDVYYLQQALEAILLRFLTPLGLEHQFFELHATEIKSPDRQRGSRGGRRGNRAPHESPWTKVPAATRFELLQAVYDTLAAFNTQDANYPLVAFGAVVDRRYTDKSKRAYDQVINKFDEMLGRHFHERGARQRGMIVHDEHQVEKDLQAWANDWRQVGSRIGRLHNIVHVPLFADSRASRLLQAADFVAFAIWRSYGVNDEAWLDQLLPTFDHVEDARHGLIHVHPSFAKGTCPCPACKERTQRSAR